MEDKIITKITHTQNLNKFNFNLTANIPIDSNIKIKNLLDINTYLFDQKVECGSGKAIVSGKMGIKALFVDTDNMTNTVSDTINFTETYHDSSITNETYLNISNVNIIHNILSTEGPLKINCEIAIEPVSYINLSLSNNYPNNEMLITKKSDISTNYISNLVNTNFEIVSNMETKNSIGKILCLNSYFTPEKISSQDGYAIVEGKITTNVLYETINENDSLLKELKETMPVKQDVQIDGLTKDDVLDISFFIDKSCEEISSEVEDDNSIISVKNKICVSGVILKNVAISIVDDIYSVENDIETKITQREYNKRTENFALSEIISNEVGLSNDEPAVDEILANLNITPEITNTYIKNNTIYLEGVVTSNFTYIDENKELKHKPIEIPFIVNTKISSETLGCFHNSISVIDSKLKVKRGTIIEVEYSLFINLLIYEKESHDMVDTYTIGKSIDFSKYDLQIFIAKQNETLWELCKRIKISPNDIHKHNKDLPLVMQGGEKIVIKR